MESQNENLSTIPSGQQESPKNFLGTKRNQLIAIGLVLLVILIIGGLYLTIYKKSPEIPANETRNKAQSQTPTLQSKSFQDDELGISFQIPEGWGQTVVRDNYSFTNLLREISFTNQPQVKLIAATKNYFYPAWFEGRGIAYGENLQQYCISQTNYLRGGNEERSTNGEDIFRQNGSYNYGDCSASHPSVNISYKEPPEKQSGGWIDINDPKNLSSQIKLSKSIFYRLSNEIYPALTLSIDAPDIQSNGFCIWRAWYGGNDYRSLKTFRCINYQEKEQIEKSFRDFEVTELAKEITFFADSIKITQASEGKTKYENHFAEKTGFTDANLGINFVYPKTLGNPVYNQETRQLQFADDQDNSFRIKINTKQDVINDEKEVENCEGPCLPPWADLDLWQKESDLIANQPVGNVACPNVQGSLAGGYGKNCKIININNQKALARYYSGYITEGGIMKEYVMYSRDGKRLDVFVHSDSAWTYNLEEFQNFEDTDFTLKIADSIVTSIKLLK